MAGEVYASISGLERLNESLRETLPMLDSLIAENEVTVAQTTQKIERTLDSCMAWVHSAYQRYQGALAELDWAERNECAFEYHYSAVYSAEAEYNRLTQNCSRIQAIYSEYTSRTAAYKKSLSDDFEDYSTLLKKSDSFLSKYAELLRRSQRAIEEDTGGYSFSRTPEKHSLFGGIKKVAAGVTASLVATAAVALSAIPVEKRNGDSPANDAIYERYEEYDSSTLAQKADQFQQEISQSSEESQPSSQQAVHDLAEGIHNVAEAAADLIKRRKEGEEISGNKFG